MTSIAKECACKKESFWIDGRAITEYKKESRDFSEKFIWTDGKKWGEYTFWDRTTSARGPCNKTDGQCMGEPQNYPDGGLCLHAGVSSINLVDPSTRSRSAALKPLPKKCYTWGNMFQCFDRLPFVCKYAVNGGIREDFHSRNITL